MGVLILAFFSIICSLGKHLIFAQDTRAQVYLDKVLYFATREGSAYSDSVIHYLCLAQEAGSSDALYLLGVSYLRGVKVKKNIPQGLALLQKSASANHKMAIELLLAFYQDSSNGVYFSSEKAKKYAEIGITLKSAPSYFFLGKYYYQKNLDSLALYYMRYAADSLVYPKAQLFLANWCRSPKNKRKAPDLSTALKYYRLVIQNPSSTLEEKSDAQVGIYYSLQLVRFLYNLQMQLFFPRPDIAPQLESENIIWR
ncbi:MAG: hypothetical protein RML72_09790 [Bacteroidia bacterium]|nr:hypothetical protein [Bacteroidia bacterium]MDW8159147.1 hypothetical protein [Bacteroidia bacterium]